MIKVVLGILLAAATASPLVRRVTIASAEIELEETTFATVAKRLGIAPIVRAGDAGGSRAQVCYATRAPSQTKYYLESSEMGGGEHITHIDVVAAGSVTAAEDPVIATQCALLPPGSAGARTDHGIMLGLTRTQVEKRLHLHGRDSASIFLYEKSEDLGTGVNAYNVSSWFRVRYASGHVTAFSTGAVSSR
jgi:hypothetical protein